MAIDEDLIVETINKLYTKLNSIKNDEREINKAIVNLSSIRDRPNGEKPTDSQTGEEMTEERRKEIFNAMAKIASKYIGGN
jgi:hypothetical protein